MARYPLVSTATIVLTNSAAGSLLTAREALENAENSFYRSRRDLVNSYPMKSRDITTSEIESLYDAHLGNEPWRYRNRFNNSGSTLKTGTYSGDINEFYVEAWGAAPTGGYPDTEGDVFLYDGERGAAWVDLIVQYGYNKGFSRSGDTRRASRTSGAGDGQTTTYYTVFEGFGELPLAYNGRGGLSDFEAHMLKLVGDAYEDEVGSALNSYTSSLDSYQGSNGSPTEAAFDSNNGTQTWNGFTGVEGGYNRPERLNADLVRETRGTN